MCGLTSKRESETDERPNQTSNGRRTEEDEGNQMSVKDSLTHLFLVPVLLFMKRRKGDRSEQGRRPKTRKTLFVGIFICFSHTF